VLADFQPNAIVQHNWRHDVSADSTFAQSVCLQIKFIVCDALVFRLGSRACLMHKAEAARHFHGIAATFTCPSFPASHLYPSPSVSLHSIHIPPVLSNCAEIESSSSSAPLVDYPPWLRLFSDDARASTFTVRRESEADTSGSAATYR
jgi:hypothetical protein